VSSILRRVENSLGRYWKRLFNFAATVPQPADVAYQLRREMVRNRYVNTDHLIAPNLYTVKMNPADYQRLAVIGDTLTGQWKEYLTDEASAAGMVFPSVPVVRLLEDDGVGAGSILVEAGFQEGGSFSCPSDTRPMSVVKTGSSEHPGNETGVFSLIVTGPDSRVEAVRPRAGITRIGRAAQNEIVLTDPSVSRYHAQLGWHGGVCVFEDCGSRNGSYVNGKMVVRHELQHGDIITLGMSRIEFRDG